MNVLEYLQNGGNVIKNPDYNPKTKKGRLQKPTLTNYKPGDNILDQAISASVGSAAGLGYNLNGIDIDSYSDYGVYVNPRQSQEELDKERAINQSNWEQLGRALVQTAGDIGTGIVITGADIMDAVLNVTDWENNDYSNPVSEYFEGLREEIRARNEIYRENPDKAFDITDFAWYASNAPSLFSNLSMFVPAFGYGKAFSGLGKLLSFNKMTNKIASAIKMTENTRDVLAGIGEATAMGSMMRLGENYLEARETYKQANDIAISNLAKMNTQQRATFIENNPQFEDMSNEEIAATIAKNSADTTFSTDLWNVVFDIAQVYGIKNLWKNSLSGNLGTGAAKFNRLNKEAAKMFGAKSEAIKDAVAAKTTLGKVKQGIKDFGYDVLHLGKTEWTEGVEEAINYIANQEGIYAAKKVFDKNIDEPTIGSYLKDPHLWESAFWGVMGGLVFGEATTKFSQFINKRFNKEWTTAEKQKESEILGRGAISEKYIQDLEKIKEGKNPYDNDATVDVNQQEQLRELATKVYIDDLMVNAANAGNLSLLESFLNDDNFTKGLREKLNISEQDAISLKTKFNEQLKDTKDLYHDTLFKANLNGANLDVAKIIATDVVRGNHERKAYEFIRDSKKAAMDKITSQEHISRDIADYFEDAKDGIVLNSVMSERRGLEALERNTTMDSKKKDANRKKITETIDNLFKIRPVENLSEDIVNQKIEAARKLYREHSDVYNSYVEYATAENNARLANELYAVNDETIKSKINKYNNFFDKSRKKIVDGAMKDIKSMFDKYGTEEVSKYRNNNENSISEEDKILLDNAFTALQLDNKDNKFLEETIKNLGKISDIARNRKAEQEKEDKESEALAEAQAKLEEQINANQGASSTGGRQQSEGTNNQTQIQNQTQSQEPIQQVQQTQSNAEKNPSDNSGTPVEDNQPFAYSIPDDIEEQEQMIKPFVYEYIGEREKEGESFETTDSESVARHIKELSDYLINLGFDKDLAQEVAEDEISIYADIRESNRRISDTRHIVAPAVKFLATGNEELLKASIDNFVNTEFEGKKYGRVYKDVTYVNLSELLNYYYKNSSETTAAYIFAQARDWLLSDRNTKYVVVDEASIRNIDRYNLVDYIKDYNNMKLRKVIDLRNEVNLSYAFDELVSGATSSVENIRNLKVGTELKTQYDEQSGRIYLIKGKQTIGYLGTATLVDGTYYRNNEEWNYDISVDVEGKVHSRLLDKFIEIFNTPNEYIIESIAIIGNEKNTDEVRNTKAIELMDYLIDNTDLSQFILLDEENPDVTKIVAGKHLGKLLRKSYEFGDPPATSLYRWFEHLATSYMAADRLIQTGKSVKIVDVRPGILNTEQTQDYEGSYIDEVLDGYDENIHELGVIKSGNILFSKASRFESTDVKGNLVIKVKRPDDTFALAFCKQVPLGEVYTNGNMKNIIDGVSDELVNIANRFLSEEYQNDPYSLENVSKNLKMLFGKDALFNGLEVTGVNTKPDGTKWVGIYYVNEQNKPVMISYFNSKHPTDSRMTANVNGSRGSLNKTIFNNVKTQLLGKCTIGVGLSVINDGIVRTNTTNRYITRQDNKTHIKIGNVDLVYNSYQDFLIKNKLIKTKLRNSRTPEVSEDGKSVAIGNFVYSEQHTGIRIRIPERRPTAKTSDPVIRELTNRYDVFNTPVIASDVESITNANSDIVKFEEYAKELAIRTGMDAQPVLEYYKELVDSGILDNGTNIKIVHDAKGDANAAYDPNNNTIIVNENVITNRKDAHTVSVARFMNIIVHENIHARIAKENLYDRVADEFAPIYKEFIEWLDKQDDATKLKYSKFAQIKYARKTPVDGKVLTNTGYEEFMVECLTNGTFMDLLNTIETSPTAVVDSTAKEKKNLFARIIDIISKLFNIVINKDTLLAKAKQASIKVLDSSYEYTTGETIVNDKEDKAAENVEESNDDNSERISNRNTGGNKSKLRRRKPSESRSMVTLSNELSLSEQTEFDRMIDTGRIGFSCV